MKEHTATHTGEAKKPNECGKSSHAFDTKAQLNNHTATVHICKNCGICGKSLKDRRHMKEHIEGVEKVIEHICETCSKGLGRKKHLLNHITTVHKISGNFTCAFCGKKFIQLSMKKIHETKHTKEEPYQCGECGESCPNYKAMQAEYSCRYRKETQKSKVLKFILLMK